MLKFYYNIQNTGQATLEYLFIMVFVLSLSLKLIGSFSEFMRDSIGNLGHVLSTNLTTGVCKSECFFGGYSNGPGK